MELVQDARSVYARMRLLFVAGVLLLCAAVWFAAYSQRTAALNTSAAQRANNDVLIAMLDQETGLRGYLQTRLHAFLEPYNGGRLALDDALRRARAHGHDDERLQDLVEQEVFLARRWQGAAELAVESPRAAAADLDSAVRRKTWMDALRDVNADIAARLDRRRHAELRRAGYVPVALIVLISLLVGGSGLYAAGRRLRAQGVHQEAQRRRTAEQAEYSDMLAMARDEDEANELLRRHLERGLPGTEAVLLRVNASGNRLEPATPAPEGSDLADALAGAEPAACLAVRFGRVHAHEEDRPPLVQCEVCGMEAGRAACVPSLVGGQVIGSVLVRGEQALTGPQVRQVRAAVAQAAPVVDNLRNLARAERRAATDALTGLPNARALADALKRLAAQASRSLSPLTALMLDLDHFKALNDDFGHDRANDVLAAVGSVLQGELRASDFAARFGGEEFVLLLPDTDGDGGMVVADKVLEALRDLQVPGVTRRVTASIGVAAFPVDAATGDHLLRVADRALYAAKHAGRDRVRRAGEAARDEAQVPTG